jgi:shikimate kinase
MKDADIIKINQNIALVGHMGSGKSIIGKIMAKKLNFKHIDSDKLIENNTKTSINEIFNNNGEDYFRKIEENTITGLKNNKNIVLSLGGGSILSKKVRNLLRLNYVTIFLDVEINILIKRLQNSRKRPLLKGEDIKNKLQKLDILRRKFYVLADITIQNTDNPVDAFSQFLIKYKDLNEKNN